MLMDYPWIIVRFRCHHCERSRDARLAILAARFGPNTMIEELLRIFMGRCPWDPYGGLHKPGSMGIAAGRTARTCCGPARPTCRPRWAVSP